MRFNYYRFPETTDDSTRVNEGCAVILKNGEKIYPKNIPDDKRSLINYVDDTLDGISVTTAKQLLKKYDGSAWTEHCERDGGCFEVTEITLKGNNSRYKYNHHL